MIVAVIALVVATAGGAIAGGALLTGANIRNNSLTGLDIKNGTVASVDVKNGTLGTVDLSAAAAKSLRGQQGLTGQQGLAGPSAAFHFDSGDQPLQWSPVFPDVATLNLPAGNYVLFGKVLARNNSVDPNAADASASCSLTLGGLTIDNTPSRSLASGDKEFFVLSGRGTLVAPGVATITCSGGANGDWVDRHIEAIKIGSLS